MFSTTHDQSEFLVQLDITINRTDQFKYALETNVGMDGADPCAVNSGGLLLLKEADKKWTIMLQSYKFFLSNFISCLLLLLDGISNSLCSCPITFSVSSEVSNPVLLWSCLYFQNSFTNWTPTKSFSFFTKFKNIN